MKVLITGGCGFIGSNFIRYLLKEVGLNEDISVVNLDKQTYAGIGKNLEHMGVENNKRYKFVRGDICNRELVESIFIEEKPDFVFNFAAESHVDRSINNSFPFVNTNVFGALNLLEVCRRYRTKRFIQVGTDEVYGSLNSDDKSSKESDTLKPRSPYAASKAAADLIALSHYYTCNLPVIVTRSSNNYGFYQYPEKIIPLFITNLIKGKKVPLMWSEENPGLNIRDWLHVHDNCRAIWFIANQGKIGEIYNIPGENERKNIEVTKIILKEFGYGEEMIEKIPHRLGHDFRYSINGEKLKKLGFEHKHKNFENELKKVCEWYKNNQNWWRALKNDFS